MTYRDTRTDERAMDDRPVAHERTVERRGRGRGRPGPGMILGLIGALALLASLFMSWTDPGVHPDDVPLRFLVDNTTATHHPSLLLVLVPLLVIAVLGSMLAGGAVLRFLAGLGTLVVVGLFVFQIDTLVTGGDTIDGLDVGLFVAAIGGIAMLVSGVLPGRVGGRRTDDQYVDAR